MSLRPVDDADVASISPDDMNELGTASPGNPNIVAYSDELYNPDLVGQNAILTYHKMRRDASVRSALRVIKAPLMAGNWYVEPADESEEAAMHARFVDAALNGMSRTFDQVISEALLMLDYGYYPFEKVFQPGFWRDEKDRAREKRVMMWKKWAPRHPIDTIRWAYDANGGPAVLHHRRESPKPNAEIPISDLLVFTFDEEAGNLEGFSLLRSAYADWYYKINLYKIDAIQKERHGIGIPMVELPPNYTPEDKAFALSMVQNLRSNEKAGVVKPPGWVIEFLELRGNQVDVLESASHHHVMILFNCLAQFLALGTQESGSRSVGSTQEDTFTRSIHYLANTICAVINKWAIPQLVKFNFGATAYPKLKVRQIGETSDMRAMSVAIRNYIESRAITPDPVLEAFLRNYHDLPIPSEEAMSQSADDRLEKDPKDFTNRTEKPTDG